MCEYVGYVWDIVGIGWEGRIAGSDSKAIPPAHEAQGKTPEMGVPQGANFPQSDAGSADVFDQNVVPNYGRNDLENRSTTEPW